MKAPVQETSNQQIIRENLKKPESERLSMESLRKIGVVSMVNVIVFHAGKEWSTAEYYDPQRISFKEVLAKFPEAFERALEKAKNE